MVLDVGGYPRIEGAHHGVDVEGAQPLEPLPAAAGAHVDAKARVERVEPSERTREQVGGRGLARSDAKPPRGRVVMRLVKARGKAQQALHHRHRVLVEPLAHPGVHDARSLARKERDSPTAYTSE